MAETYNGAICFVRSLKRLTGKQISLNEGIGYFDIGEILENGDLILNKMGRDNPVDKGSYMIADSLLELECETPEENEPIKTKKRIIPGSDYLVCFVDNLPIVIDRIRKASEVF